MNQENREDNPSGGDQQADQSESQGGSQGSSLDADQVASFELMTNITETYLYVDRVYREGPLESVRHLVPENYEANVEPQLMAMEFLPLSARLCWIDLAGLSEMYRDMIERRIQRIQRIEEQADAEEAARRNQAGNASEDRADERVEDQDEEQAEDRDGNLVEDSNEGHADAD